MRKEYCKINPDCSRRIERNGYEIESFISNKSSKIRKQSNKYPIIFYACL